MTIGEYVRDSATMKERYTKIQVALNNLYGLLADAATNADVQNYSFDDGQTKISTGYRSISELQKAIFNLEKVENMLAARISGTRVMRLADSQALQSYLDVATRRH